MRVWTQNKRSPSQEMRILPVPKTFNLKERNGVIHIITQAHICLFWTLFPSTKEGEEGSEMVRKKQVYKTLTTEPEIQAV